MLNLATTTSLVELITASAGSIDVVPSWVDLSGTTVTPGGTPVAITTATTTTIVAAPAASTVRNVKSIFIRNKGSSSNTVTVQVDVGGTNYEIRKVTLGPGDVLCYDEGGLTWEVLNETSIYSNRSAADQLLNAATILSINNTALDATNVKVGTIFEWTLTLSKGATGTAAATFGVHFGTAGTSADTLRSNNFSTGTQTAVADTAEIQITAAVRTTGASGVVHFKFEMKHNLATTGLSNQQIIVAQAASAAFDLTVSQLKASLDCVSGTANSITINRVRSERTDP